MSDLPIASAAALTGATLASNDLLPVLDVSATAGSKGSKITVAELFTGRTAVDFTTNQLTLAAMAANTPVLTATGHSLTGSNTTSLLDLAGTWNTAGTPTAFKFNITNTASNAASLLLDMQNSATSKFSVRASDGAISINGGSYASIGRRIDVDMLMLHDVGSNSGIAVVGIGSSNFNYGLSVCGGASVLWTGDTPASTADLLLRRAQAATLQLGLNDPSTPTAQAIKAHDVTSGTGASLTLAGGKGSVAGGSLILGTYDTSTLRNRVTIDASGLTTFTAAGNTGVIAATGYSLTGSNAASMIDLAGTWNTSGSPTGIKLNINNTASGTSSLLCDLQASSTSQFKVTKSGRVYFGPYGSFIDDGGSGHLLIANSISPSFWSRGGSGSCQVPATLYLGGLLSVEAEGVPLVRVSATQLQLGLDGTGPSNMVFTSGNRITSDGVGANLTIAAGNGRGAAGGSLALSYYTTAVAGTAGTLTTGATLDTAGKFAIASGGAFQLGNDAVTGLVAGALAATTTASIVIYDSAGTAYRIPCIAP
jgi:hypothetical protein